MPGMVLALLMAATVVPLPGTRPLEMAGDPVRLMVDGMEAWLARAAAAAPASRGGGRERLRTIIGAVDERLPFTSPELVATLDRPARVGGGAGYAVYAARWPVIEGVTAEGLLWQPAARPAARIVVLPDAGTAPEDSRMAARLAAAGCQVLSPVLIDRQSTFSGNPRIGRSTRQPHREFIYRMAFMVGRHIIGYEVQKALAAADWFARQRPAAPVGVWGEGDGGPAALYAAALDERIGVAGVAGYGGHADLWAQPIDRNVWSLQRDFSDADIAGLMEGRTLARDAEAFLAALGIGRGGEGEAPRWEAKPDPEARMKRRMDELIAHVRMLVERSEAVREALWKKEGAEAVRARVWDEMIGRLPAGGVPLNPRTQLSYRDAAWDGYETVLDVAPDVFAYGVLLVPKGIRPGERRPVVVVQHGLEGRAQDLFGQPEVERGADGRNTSFHYYRNLGSRLAEMGYVVFSAQNPYVSPFRHIQRRANPLGLSLFSFIVAQHGRLLEWLGTLDFVDQARIGFYGLSYGGKTALRAPPLLGGYALSICSGDFNEWVRKVTSTEAPYSYMFTQEWEIPEWNLAHVANHAELAMLMAPRPFMVERGHRDGVGVDEWVAYEYAKVRRWYDEAGIGERARIAWFNGTHRIDGVETLDFLQRFLGKPKP